MLSDVLLALKIGQVLAYGLLVFKLFRTGLARIYRYLAAFAIFEMLRVAAAAAVPNGTDLYAAFYVVTQPVVWLLYALVTLEVFQSVFRSHPGIAAFSRRVISAAVAVSALLAITTLFLKPDADSPFFKLEIYLAVERAINFSLLCFVLILIAFLTWFPVPLARNALVHSSVFSLYFGVKALAVLTRTVAGPSVNGYVNVTLLLVSVLSLTLWATLLSPQGEAVRVRAGYRRSSIDENRLMEQLESINRTLLRSAQD